MFRKQQEDELVEEFRQLIDSGKREFVISLVRQFNLEEPKSPRLRLVVGGDVPTVGAKLRRRPSG